MLRVGLLGDGTTIVARRLDELNIERNVRIEALSDRRDSWAKCHLVVGAGARGDGAHRGAADVWLDDIGPVGDLWRSRLVPFATNLAAGRRAPRARRPVLASPNPAWPEQAQRLIGRLLAASDDEDIVRADHIGSTAVPGLPAKDLVDIQVVVTDLDAAARVAGAGPEAGFVRARGPLVCVDRYGIAHPEEVVVDADPGRPVNVNIRPVGAPIWRETLLFRDWLRSQPAARREYAALKQELAARPGRDVDDYGSDKFPWISAAAGRAEEWAAATLWEP